MKLLLFLFSIFTISTSAKESTDTAHQFVVWNVGQGQWTTLINNDSCIHFDMGGEKNITAIVNQICRAKINIIHLSHWDWDHLSFVVNYLKIAPNTCLWQKPLGATTEKRQKTFDKIQICNAEIQRLFTTSDFSMIFKPNKNLKNTNDRSLVFSAFNSHILIPGDSTIKQESLWSKHQQQLQNIYGLVLGHHGSRTSTSNLLLNHLSNLKWAVASAKYKKYGHPHFEVTQRLKVNKIPLLRTEDWGNIHFMLKADPYNR